jgi:hypothetical protein
MSGTVRQAPGISVAHRRKRLTATAPEEAAGAVPAAAGRSRPQSSAAAWKRSGLGRLTRKASASRAAATTAA